MGRIFNKLKAAVGGGTERHSVSTYQYLLNKGFTDEQILAASVESRDLYTRSWGVSVAGEGFDGKPLVGIVYRCDYKYEEEAGGGDLREAFGVPRMQAQMSRGARGKFLVRQFIPGEGGLGGAEVALAVGVEPMQPPVWGEDVRGVARGRGSAVEGWAPTLSYRDYAGDWESGRRVGGVDLPGQRKWLPLERHTVAELEAIALQVGGVGRKARGEKKAEYVARLEAERQRGTKVFPGWFQSGKVLILRAGDVGSVPEQIAQEVLWRLRYAYDEGTLGFGSGGSNPFATGLSLFDAQDLAPGVVEAWKSDLEWVEAQEAALKPVADELAAEGHRWYALGRPTLLKSKVGGDRVYGGDGEVHYWLNGQGYPLSGSDRGSAQPYGWYTLDELRERKFVEALEASESARVGRPVKVSGVPRSYF
jgi:hypothetical protein